MHYNAKHFMVTSLRTLQVNIEWLKVCKRSSF